MRRALGSPRSRATSHPVSRSAPSRTYPLALLGLLLTLVARVAVGTPLTGEEARFSYAAGYQLGEALISDGLEVVDPAEVGSGLAAVVRGAPIRLTPEALGAAMRTRGEGTAAQRLDFSYAVGVQRGQQLVQQEVGSIDAEAIGRGVADALGHRPAQIAPGEMMVVVAARKERLAAERAAVARANAEAGAAFLAANRDKEGVEHRRSGLQYEVIAEGKGNKPDKDATVVVRYRGSHLDGTEFDSSERHGGPATLALSQVIAGWQEALVRMRPGDRWRLFIPPELAYGSAGQPPVIGPNETLIFEIELISVR
ncbi:MAG: hypothetical protein COW73_11285 [Nitrospirae bacterium CG18_big_fil_WC_8_21_14_2_50_70_55]|nr:FKBP-type peptidyl-prolyl cis-trans isomerase [Deltaproteobacteria bacterium]PIQ03404.1 MAG: hypothetical protein COW73_11285 [Nitrospirae bacterium CG18_big_fil_WC_8_21_14_2_50_70_55]PIU79686.1 MAG: hypothetical protein COS73_03150 [Nitrospirae bacterium CG06_land_8_20_14_3_00_70_43]PIX83777.1 MAG: hypothetical protein COZ33_03630 [Nitrospirae bacterium CG_4_10_14_3_um_filter_70_108]NCP97100.1 FKBP-type peptidyl-prolyl cis-trans isomerase [Deltaproteobacteria bacterium]